jgi:hypothetical protein
MKNNRITDSRIYRIAVCIVGVDSDRDQQKRPWKTRLLPTWHQQKCLPQKHQKTDGLQGGIPDSLAINYTQMTLVFVSMPTLHNESNKSKKQTVTLVPIPATFN